MGKAVRNKGTRGELEVANLFRAHGYDVNRTPNSGGLRTKGDLVGQAPWHVEVKRQEVLRIPAWLRQAAAEADGRTPLLVFRQNRSDWYVCLPLLDFLEGRQ